MCKIVEEGFTLVLKMFKRVYNGWIPQGEDLEAFEKLIEELKN